MWITNSLKKHEVHKFIKMSEETILAKYKQIRERTIEDPGTAGDRGEQSWANLLKEWLPPYFQIETKGRILFENDTTSDQIDVVILNPAYPKLLLEDKLYIAGGVVAAFECKNTLKKTHIKKAVSTAAKIKKDLPIGIGTPYKELNSQIIFGVLAHSHTWEGADVIQRVTDELSEADKQHVQSPLECLDFLCIADLATWLTGKTSYLKHPHAEKFAYCGYEKDGNVSTSYVAFPKFKENDTDFNSPIGIMLTDLYSKIAYHFPDMQRIEKYFSRVNLGLLNSGGGNVRNWPLSVYSDTVQQRLLSEEPIPTNPEWLFG